MTTFNQIRSDVNTLLNAIPSATPYRKNHHKDIPKLFRYVANQLGVNISKYPMMKDREYKQILIDWINSTGTRTSFKEVCEKNVTERLIRKQKQFFAKRNFTTITTPENALVIGNLPSAKFYQTSEWKALRYAAINYYGRDCACCGATYEDSKRIHVDHIKPRSIYPEIALSLENVQILCDDCNYGKSNTSEEDWREK